MELRTVNAEGATKCRKKTDCVANPGFLRGGPGTLVPNAWRLSWHDISDLSCVAEQFQSLP